MKIDFRGRFIFRFLLLILFAGSFAAARISAQEKAAGSSGFYDSLVVGIDNNKKLTGYFSEQGGWDQNTKAPLFNCTIFIYGEPAGDIYKVTAGYPGEKNRIAGELKFVEKDGEKTIEINLEKEPGGCGNVHPFSRKVGGDDFVLDEKGDWTAVRIVSNKKAYFCSRPDLSAKKKSYVVQGDSVRIFKTENGWVEAEFGTEKKTRGWLKEADLFPVNPAS